MKSDRVRRWRLALAAFVGLTALVFGWLISAEESPFYEYFLWHVFLPNAWVKLNLLPLLIAFRVSGNVHQPDPTTGIIAAFVQWCLIGYLLSLCLVRRSPAQIPGVK